MKPTTDKIAERLMQYADVTERPIESAFFNAAADLITKLQQELIDERHRHDRLQDFCVAQGEELSELKKQSRWIPVTERLPENDDDVLILTPNGINAGYINVGYFNVHDKSWYDYVNTGVGTVAHWMPLPEPPKEV